jgi:hypothetical protein
MELSILKVGLFIILKSPENQKIWFLGFGQLNKAT